MKAIKNLNSIINSKNKLLYLLSILTTIISVFLSLLTPLFIRFFIDNVLDNKAIEIPDFFMGLINKVGGIEFLKSNIYISALILIFLSLLNAFITFVKERSVSFASESSIKKLKDKLFAHIQKLPFDFLNKSQTGDLLQRCTSDVDTIRKFISTQTIELIRIISLVVITLFIMFSVNLKLALVSTGIIPIILIASYVFFLNIKKVFLKADEKEGEFTTVLQENLSGVRVVRAFGREKYELDKFQEKNVELADLIYKLIKLLAYFWSITDIFCFTQIGAVIFISAIMANNGEITIGTCILFFTYENMLVFPIRQLGRILSDFGKMEVAFKRINEILEVREEEETKGAIKSDINGDIVFDKVFFKFSDSDENMLKDISFTAKKGETIAFLGSTGSGKSTLMYLLLRLYDYNRGSIIINGTELRNIEKNHLRKKIGMVLQDPFLYSKTIKENIKMAKANAGDNDIFKATKTAKVHDVINSFEKGYETIVGEKGVTLSGGQKQRLAIARTLIKNSDILIFDDSLSAIDTETDSAIREELKKIEGEKITFLISQRITTLKDADKIIVLEKGYITAQGKHDELIKTEGLYKRIWDIQSMLFDEFDNEVI